MEARILHFELAEASWLLPYLRRILEGEVVTERELVAHFVRRHGRAPQLTIWPRP